MQSSHEDAETEPVKITKTKAVCPACEAFAAGQQSKPVVVMCCEGGCARGEIARRAANLLCFKLAPEKTVRLCLGGAFTKDTGQRRLARNARRLIAIEGCFIQCATRMMQGALPGLKAEVVVADDHYELEPMPFGLDDLSEHEANACAQKVAIHIATAITEP
jgi:uncharacterized metal-binding protein